MSTSLISRSALREASVAFAAAILFACTSTSSTPTTYAPQVHGVAASGLPIAGGELYLVDAAGKSAHTGLAPDGSYHLDVTGLTPPLLIEVIGAAGGRPVVLHSAATTADVLVARALKDGAVVNVTPLTELQTAFVLGGDPATVFEDPARDLSGVTAPALKAAGAVVASKVAPVLRSVGAGPMDIRTTAFVADGTGMDRALDALRLTSTVDPATGKTTYELLVVTSESLLVVDPTKPDERTPVAFGEGDGLLLNAAATALPDIEGRLAELAGLFQTALPDKQQILPYFAADGFRHNGLGLDAYLDGVLLKPGSDEPIGYSFSSYVDYRGFAFGRAAIAKVIGAENLYLSVEVTPAGYVRPWSETFLMTKMDGQWLIKGNQNVALTAVNYMAFIEAKPLTKAELDARPDIVSGIATWDPARRTYYQIKVPGTDLLGWIGFEEYGVFSTLGWVGDGYDHPDTPLVNEREQRRQYTRYVGTPSGRVQKYMIFYVSSEQIDPRVAWVKLSGPGLPEVGLTLVPPSAQYPRPHMVIRGDYFNWDSFNTERCAQVAANPYDPNDARDGIPNCSLDWSKIASGTKYSYKFYDAGGNLLEEVTERLSGTPPGEAELYANRDRFFPQFILDASQQQTVANVFDTASGAPFGDGGTVSVAWKLPSERTIKMGVLFFNRQYYLDDAYWDPTTQREETHAVWLYGKVDEKGVAPTSQSCSFAHRGALTSWAWTTLIATDIRGNGFWHEVEPTNPY